MSTYKLTLAYEGTNFSGWQAQPGQRTVQGVLREAWQSITGEEPRMTATSRTDAGVHALGQVVGIETETRLAAEELLRALHAKLPEDIVPLAVESVADDFHATYDAIGKRYRYLIHTGRQRALFDRQLVWHVPQRLDEAAMHRAGQSLVGKHDFASFQSAGSPRDSTVRTLTDVVVKRDEGDEACVLVEVAGDGFLYNMVRNIVGTLVEVGKGRRDESWVAEVLAARDRRAAGQTAPPQGLTLLKVDF